MSDKVPSSLIAAMFLIDEIRDMRHGWGRKFRARKKFLVKQLRIGIKQMKKEGLLQ